MTYPNSQITRILLFYMLISTSKTILLSSLKSFNIKLFHLASSFVDLFDTFSFSLLYKNIILYIYIYIYIYVNKKIRT